MCVKTATFVRLQAPRMAEQADHSSAQKPHAVSQRILQLDALRGFAMFGILMVNIFVFHAPYAHYAAFYGAFSDMQGLVVEGMITLFGGKFMFIFAFLFGYGCQLQIARQGNTAAFRNYWWRRMLLLAGFGLLHLLLFWFGDILLPYALLGFLLPWFQRLSTAWLVCLGLLFYGTAALYHVPQWLFQLPEIHMTSTRSLAAFIETYSTGSFLEILPWRMHEYLSFSNEKLVFYMPKELGLFLLGIAAARKQMHSWIAHPKTLAFLLGSALFIVLWTIGRHAIIPWCNPAENPWTRAPLIAIISAAEFLHGAVYVLGFFLLWRKSWFQKIMNPMRYVGRASLSNYILQSVVCIFLFYGYGLGWYGQLKPLDMIGLVLLIFALQTLLSFLWFKRFKQGPLEAIWKKWSYGFSRTNAELNN